MATDLLTPVPGTSQQGESRQLRRVLGVPSLVLFGLVYMVPVTVFTTYGIVTEPTGGRLSVAYLVTLAAMVFTARSYARMADDFRWPIWCTPTRRKRWGHRSVA